MVKNYSNISELKAFVFTESINYINDKISSMIYFLKYDFKQGMP